MASENDKVNRAAIAAAIDNIVAGLERTMGGLQSLKRALEIDDPGEELEFDPRDPRNKYAVGGQMKLTPRGEEICYRLFDARHSKYSVAALMDISFGAAKHRQKAWEKLGGFNREKRPVQ